MHDARGKTRGVTEIEEKAALQMAQPDVEERVAEDSVHESRLG